MNNINNLYDINDKDNLIEGLMKSNGLYVLVAKPKVGKSLLALQIADAICNNKKFFNKETKSYPVLYVSTEINEYQLKQRINQTGYLFKDNNQFFYLIKSSDNKLCIREDLLLTLKEFSEQHNGNLVIIDMMAGIDYGSSFDLNNYTEIEKVVMNKYRELSSKYNLTFLLIHHSNKIGKTLGSTGIEGFVDGIFYLEDTSNNNYKFTVSSRDFESFTVNLIRNEHLQFEIVDEDLSDLHDSLLVFLRHMYTVKELTFSMSDIITKLKLNVTPTQFGILLNNSINRLKQEGVIIEKTRTSTTRCYKAIFKEELLNDKTYD